MERLDLEIMIQEFLEGSLSPEDEARLRKELDNSAEARKLLEQYRLLIAAEESAAARRYTAAPEISVKVMDAIEAQSVRKRSWRFYMNRRQLLYAASFCAAMLALVIVRREGSDYRDFFPPPPAEQAAVAPREGALQPKAPQVPLAQPERAPEPASLPAAEPKPGPVLAEPRAHAVEHDAQPVPVRKPARKQEEAKAERLKQDQSGPMESFGFDKATVAPRPPSSGSALGANVEQFEAESFGAVAGASPMRQLAEEASASKRSVTPASPSVEFGKGKVQGEGGAGLGNRRNEAPQVQSRSLSMLSGAESASAYVHIPPGTSAEPPAAKAYVPSQRFQGPSDQEEYQPHYDSERVKVSVEPVSTFGIDVDTGSYSNVRRFLSEGRLPPKDAVRIEELLNYFDYDYPKQIEQPFAVYYEIAPSPLEQKRMLLKLGIRARDIEDQVMPPRSLIFLVDVSGSMADANKLPLLKQALHVLVDGLREQDRLALVTYADGAQVVLRPTAGSAKGELHNAVERLEASGSTNGGAGIDLAFDLAAQSRNTEGPTSVILATDGDFNVGNYSFDGLMRLIEEKRRSGISLNTLGLGTGNLKERNLEQLADRGNGSYYYLDSYKEAREVLTKKLGGIVHTIAHDVKLQVEFNPEHVKEYRLIGYDNRRLAKEDFSDDAADSGEIGAGHTVTALYEIVLKNADGDDQTLRYGKSKAEESEDAANKDRDSALAGELAYVKLRFKRSAGSASEKIEYPILRDKLQADGTKAGEDFRFAAAVAYFGDALRGSRYFGAVSPKNIADLAKSSLGSDPEGKRAEFQRLAEQVSWLLYSGHDRRREERGSPRF